MMNAFVCGNFNHEEEEDGPSCPNTSNSPKKSKRKDSRKDNNPYSTRGLDKFSALLADLDQRRQKVYSQMSPHDISFVRFAYSNTDDFVPIVVKVKNNKSEDLKVRHLKSFSGPLENTAATDQASTGAAEERKQPKSLESNNKDERNSNKKKNKRFFSWDMLKHPSFYVPAVMILILMFLIVFGRSVATLCTCIMWYVVPTLSDSLKMRKTVKKKDYARGLSEKKMVTEQGLPSPTSTGDSSKDNSSGKHSHQKSW